MAGQPFSSIELPEGLEVIGEHAFASIYTELRSISIPDTVTTIGMAAFAYTYQLESITLPASVEEVEYDAFSRSNIGTLIIRSERPPVICDYRYYGVNYEYYGPVYGEYPLILPMGVIYVPDESLPAYREAEGWSESAAKFRGLSEYQG